jgi:hypothetical protein
MVMIMTKDGSGRLDVRGGFRYFPAVILLAAACVQAGSGPTLEAAEVLRWKFKPGDTLRFSIEQKLNISMKGMETERKSTRTQTEDIRWKVISVAPDGEAEITHRIERVRMKAEEPPYMPFDFDSATSKTAQPGFEAVTRQLMSQVGGEFNFKIKPNGEITDIKVSEETIKHLRESAPAGSPEAEVSEKAVKDSLLQSGPPAFPDGPLEPGKAWSSKPARFPLQFAFLILEKTFTYQGPDPKSAKLHLVDIQTTVKLEPIEGTDVKATIRKQEGKGGLTFDVEAGRVVHSRLGMKVDMAITAMGQTIEQSTEMNSSMTFLP